MRLMCVDQKDVIGVCQRDVIDEVVLWVVR